MYSIHDDEDEQSFLTHRYIQLHNEINEIEQKVKSLPTDDKYHHHVVESISRTTTSTSTKPMSPKSKPNYLPIHILPSSLSLQLAAPAPAPAAPAVATTTSMTMDDTFTFVSENTDNYNNCPKYYYHTRSNDDLASSPPPLPPQIPIPAIIVRRLTSI